MKIYFKSSKHLFLCYFQGDMFRNFDRKNLFSSFSNYFQSILWPKTCVKRHVLCSCSMFMFYVLCSSQRAEHSHKALYYQFCPIKLCLAVCDTAIYLSTFTSQNQCSNLYTINFILQETLRSLRQVSFLNFQIIYS